MELETHLSSHTSTSHRQIYAMLC